MLAAPVPTAVGVSRMEPVDAIDARLLQALGEEPRATVVALAERLGLARNTVQARLTRMVEKYLETARKLS